MTEKSTEPMIDLNLECTPEFLRMLDWTARTLGLGTNRGRAVGLAVAMLELAARAHLQGKAVGIAPNAEVLEQQFVGFWRDETETTP